MNNKCRKQLENENIGICCQLSCGIARFCTNGIGIAMHENNVFQNVFDNEICYAFHCHDHYNENFYVNEHDHQLPYPTPQVVIISNKMNDVTTEINVFKGLLAVCSCDNNNDNQIISGMFDFDLLFSIFLVFFLC